MDSLRKQAFETLAEIERRLGALEERPELKPVTDALHGRIGQLERRPAQDVLAANTAKLNAAGEVETEAAGARTALTLGAKIRASTTVVESTPSARPEGSTVRLGGAVEAKEALVAGETLFTLPGGTHPATPQTIDAITYPGTLELRMTLSAAGVATLSGELHLNEFILLDGKTFALS
jgi:hypothetical protein